MARTAIVFGLLLCGLTLYGLVVATMKSPFQFVPLMFGIPVLFCGVVGLNPHRRRIAGMAAASVMTMGIVVGLMATMRYIMVRSEGAPPRPVLFALSILMTLLCLVFVGWFMIRWMNDRLRRAPKKQLIHSVGTVQLADKRALFKTPSDPPAAIDLAQQSAQTKRQAD